AVAALLTAVQTYPQQQHTQDLQQVYSWILGSLSLASWSEVLIILPYAAVAAALLLAHRRLLAGLRVGGGAADRGHRGDARHRRGGRGQRADRLRGHHRPAYGAIAGRRELPDRAARLHDRRCGLPGPRC